MWIKQLWIKELRYILLDVISFAAGKGGAKLVVNPTLLAQLQQQVKDDLLKKQAAQQQQIKADQLEKEAAQQQGCISWRSMNCLWIVVAKLSECTYVYLGIILFCISIC